MIKIQNDGTICNAMTCTTENMDGQTITKMAQGALAGLKQGLRDAFRRSGLALAIAGAFAGTVLMTTAFAREPQADKNEPAAIEAMAEPEITCAHRGPDIADASTGNTDAEAETANLTFSDPE